LVYESHGRLDRSQMAIGWRIFGVDFYGLLKQDLSGFKVAQYSRGDCLFCHGRDVPWIVFEDDVKLFNGFILPIHLLQSRAEAPADKW